MQKLFEALYDKGCTVLNNYGQYDPSVISGPFMGYTVVTFDYTEATRSIPTDYMSVSVNEDIIELKEIPEGFMAKTPDGDQIHCHFTNNEEFVFTKRSQDGTTLISKNIPFAAR